MAPPSAPSAPSAPAAVAAAAAASGDPLESEQTAELLRQLILLKLEEDELVSTGRELRSRLAAERSEIGRLKDTIHEMETLYKYRWEGSDGCCVRAPWETFEALVYRSVANPCCCRREFR